LRFFSVLESPFFADISPPPFVAASGPSSPNLGLGFGDGGGEEQHRTGRNRGEHAE
jgi:hypothetical protein